MNIIQEAWGLVVGFEKCIHKDIPIITKVWWTIKTIPMVIRHRLNK